MVPAEREPARSAVSGAVPLPGAIVPGEYRLVRSDGFTRLIVITPEELAERGFAETASPRPMYVLHDGRLRWYFIRIQRPEHVLEWAGRSLTLFPSRAVHESLRAVTFRPGNLLLGKPVVARRPHRRRPSPRIVSWPPFAGWFFRPPSARLHSGGKGGKTNHAVPLWSLLVSASHRSAVAMRSGMLEAVRQIGRWAQQATRVATGAASPRR